MMSEEMEIVINNSHVTKLSPNWPYKYETMMLSTVSSTPKEKP
jgi:hypothetical protein